MSPFPLESIKGNWRGNIRDSSDADGDQAKPTEEPMPTIPLVVFLDEPQDVPTVGNRFIVCIERKHSKRDMGEIYISRTSRLKRIFADYPRWLEETEQGKPDRIDLEFLDEKDIDIIVLASKGLLVENIDFDGDISIKTTDCVGFSRDHAIQCVQMANIYLATNESIHKGGIGQ